MRYYQVDKVDGIIADLGISFHQIDEPGRGFSFRNDEKIDMRMNKSAGFTAENILNEYETKQLANILKEYGELERAWQIAQTIVKERAIEKISTTGRLIEILGKFVPRNQENKFFAKVFQALRIEVNHEMESLKEFLHTTSSLLQTGGRLVVISYHSTEDRLVKNFMKSGNFEGHIEKDIYGHYSIPFRIINKKVIVPEQEEINTNPRSRSAKLRIAEKNQGWNKH
jgi:16S rRNA (cytosine1402-N4)-methyltransferase